MDSEVGPFTALKQGVSPRYRVGNMPACVIHLLKYASYIPKYSPFRSYVTIYDDVYAMDV